MADNGTINPIFKYLQGRTTTLLWFFSVTGTVLQYIHRLDPVYIGLAGLILTAAMGHSIKEDYKEFKLSPNGNGNGHKDDDKNADKDDNSA